MDEKRRNLNEQQSFGLAAAPESEQRDIDFRYYLLALLNRRWMILTITIFVVVGTTVYSLFQTPQYRAKSIVDISPPTSYIMLPDSAPQSAYLKKDSFINTEYRLLEGREMAKGVARKLNLTKKDLKSESIRKSASREEELSDIASQLKKMIKINPVPETNLCEIVILSPDPKLSMILANGWAQEYVERRLDSMQQYTRRAEELLLEQVKSLQQSIAAKEKELHDYSLEKQIYKVDRSKSLSGEELTSINHSLAAAKEERISVQVRYFAMKSARRDTIPEVVQHSSVVRKREEYLKLQNEYAEKSRLYKEGYPEMVRLRNQMELMQRSLEPAIEQAYREVLGEAESEYKGALAKEHALEGQLVGAKRNSVDAGQKELPYDRMTMEIENKKQLLELLLQKQNQTDVLADVQEKSTPTSRIIELAELPKEVFTPNIQKNILFSILAGILGSLALALLLEYFDRSLKTPEDVETHIQLPFLGLVPHYLGHNDNGHGEPQKALATKKTAVETALDRYIPYRLSINDVSSSASEALKTIRTSLLLSFPGRPPRTILITSSRAGEGKTFISCNLAVTLTQLEKRVVIVDADMRNPRLHKVWNLPNNTGLSIYLTSDVSAASITRPGPSDRLSLISSGPKTPRPAELLSSSRFEELMRELEKDFDFIIIDSPPVLPVTDSVILASRVDSVLMVVRGGSTPREVVKMAKKKLSRSNGVIVGTVLNAIDLTDPYYYYRYYSKYQYYGEGHAPPSDIPPQA